MPKDYDNNYASNDPATKLVGAKVLTEYPIGVPDLAEAARLLQLPLAELLPASITVTPYPALTPPTGRSVSLPGPSSSTGTPRGSRPRSRSPGRSPPRPPSPAPGSTPRPRDGQKKDPAVRAEDLEPKD